MEIEDAKLILRSFRPNGEDVGDPFFAEALLLAERDPELAHWFAEQLAFDDKVREAFQQVSAPPHLRDSIRLSQKTARFSQKSIRPVWQRQNFLLIAAALMVLLMATTLLVPHNKPETPRLTAAGLTEWVLELAGSGGIRLGKMSRDPTEIRAWLVERGAPSDLELPPGLRDVPGIGCQTYSINGTKVSLVCFLLGKDQVVHLFVVENNALQGATVSSQPSLHTKNGQSWATWTSGGKSYVMTGTNVSQEKLRKLI